MTRVLLLALAIAAAAATLPSCSASSNDTGDDDGASAGGSKGTGGKSSGKGGASAGYASTGDDGDDTAGTSGDDADDGDDAAGTSGDDGGGGTGGGDDGGGGSGVAGGPIGAGGEPDGSGGGPLNDGKHTLVIVPQDAVLSPPAGVAPTLGYHAVMVSADAPDVDVTDETDFEVLDQTFGAFSGPLFSAPAGSMGQGQISATAEGLTAFTTITITPPQVVIGPGADGNSAGAFGGPTTGPAPTIVYPPNGVLLPPNTNSLEIHFQPAAGQTLFALEVSSPSVQLTAYFGCTPVSGGCVYAPDQTFWNVLANTARGGDPVSYVLKGTDGQGGPVGASDGRTMQFSTEDLLGGIYYWNDVGVIERYDFGVPATKAETFLGTQQTGGICVGCHVLSRDGSKMLVGLNIPAPAPFQMFDVATTTKQWAASDGANFFSFDPSTKLFLSSNGVSTDLRDSATGTITKKGVISKGTMPDWSPNGQLVVYAKPESSPPFGFAVPGVDQGSILAMNADTGESSAVVLVPYQGQNNYYPAFAPNSDWIVFNRSPGDRNSFDNASVETDDNGDPVPNGKKPDGILLAVSAAGGNAIQLANASTGVGDQWAKWAPVEGTYEGGKIAWVIFSSQRAYGLRSADYDPTQLWMAAIDFGKLAQGQDGSFPAFWLPFQGLGSGNHIAQWVTKVARPPCNVNSDCNSGYQCRAGGCIPAPH